MPFEINNLRALGRNSTTGNYIWLYGTLSDNIATILGSGYFETRLTDVAVNDLVIIQATDGTLLVRVSAISSTTPFPATLQSQNAASLSVNTASIPDVGGSPPQANVQSVLEVLARELNRKVFGISFPGGSGLSIFSTDTTDPTEKTLIGSRLQESTGIDIRRDPTDSDVILFSSDLNFIGGSGIDVNVSGNNVTISLS